MKEKKDNTSADYELKIDTQVERFLETKQKLTYFLITASTAIVAFVVNFVIKYRNEAGTLIWMVIVASLAGLLTSGASLLNMYYENKSYRQHLKYRYQKKTWDMLSDKQQKEWDLINHRSSRLLNFAFALLFTEIAFVIVFYVIFFMLNEKLPEKTS